MRKVLHKKIVNPVSKLLATTASTVMSIIILGISSNQTSVATTLYRITDIGTLGGTFSMAYDINELGQVVGTSGTISADQTNSPGAFLWENGNIKNLGFSYAFGINNSTQVVGSSSNNSGDRAILWQNDEIQDIGAIFPNGESFAIDINDNGELLGSSSPNGTFLLKLDSSGNIVSQRIIFPRGNISASRINNLNQVIGAIYGEEFADVGFLAEDGVLTQLEPLPNDTSSTAQSINNLGQVVGFSNSVFGPSFDPRAVIWQNGQVNQLAINNNYQTIAQDINDSGQIVGYGFLSNNPYSQTSALLWENSEVFNLNNLIAPNSDNFDLLTRANSINNLGQIVGTGLINGQNRAFFATPISVDEPASILGLLAVSCFGISSAFKYNRKSQTDNCRTNTH